MLNLPSVTAHHKVVDLHSPETILCPKGHGWAERNEVRSRHFWIRDLAVATVVEVQAGCYICDACPPGERWFMMLPGEYATPRQYDVPSQQAVVKLVRKHRMSVEEATAVGRDLLHLIKLDAATVLEWLREEGETIDGAARLRQMAAAFSGELALDEVYDAGWYQLKATDPINGVELAWKLERGSPTEADVRSFLLELKAAGINPDLVVTDGSTLYPGVLAEVWPEAKHQRCVFHFIKQVNEDLSKAFWEIYDTMPKPKKRKAGRPKKRGRPRADKAKRTDRLTVRQARYILLKREDRLSEEERQILQAAIALCPHLGDLRRFVVQMHDLFGPTTQTLVQADEKRQKLLDDEGLNTAKALTTALGRLRDDDLFARLTRYLAFENADKTSNHVERENREFRNRQNTHYRMRSRRSLRSLLDLLSARHPIPAEPRRLRPKNTAHRKEQQAA